MFLMGLFIVGACVFYLMLGEGDLKFKEQRFNCINYLLLTKSHSIFVPKIRRYFIALSILIEAVSGNLVHANPINDSTELSSPTHDFQASDHEDNDAASAEAELSPDLADSTLSESTTELPTNTHDSREPDQIDDNVAQEETEIPPDLIAPTFPEDTTELSPNESQASDQVDNDGVLEGSEVTPELADSTPVEGTIQKVIKRTSVQRWKYGCSVLFGTANRLGLFIEHKFKVLGLEVGLSWFSDNYASEKLSLKKLGESPRVSYQSVAIPFIVKLYPGDDRQFAIRFGIQGGYIVGGRISKEDKYGDRYLYDPDDPDEDSDIDFSLLSPKNRIKSWEFVSILGLDYETDEGIIMGFDIVDELNIALRKYKQKMVSDFIFHIGLNVGALFY
jgi:hypothetical protein